MKKWRKIKWKKVQIDEIDDRVLLINLYLTQLFTLLTALLLIFFQDTRLAELLSLPQDSRFFLWGSGFALAVVAIDLLLSRIVPEEAADDGGINKRVFANRPLWHIAVIAFVVAVCEELLFRGAIQYVLGPYWTSILFAAIHVRYLRHWLMTGLVFCISYGLGWIYLRTGTLWTPIVAHFWIDLIMGCILKYSGGNHEQK
jgi:hypothetical protein